MRLFQAFGMFLLMWGVFLVSDGHGQTDETTDEFRADDPALRRPSLQPAEPDHPRLAPRPERQRRGGRRRHRDEHGLQGRDHEHDRDGPPGHERPEGRQRPHHDPEMRALVHKDRELQEATEKLARRLRNVKSASDDEAEGSLDLQSLKELVNEHFEVRQQRRHLQLDRLRKELKRLEESIERRNEAREVITERRLAELTGESHDLDF